MKTTSEILNLLKSYKSIATSKYGLTKIGIARKNTVIFVAIFVKRIALKLQHIIFAELGLIQSSVVDRNLGHSSGIKGIQNFGVGKKHPLLILLGCRCVIDIGKTVGL